MADHIINIENDQNVSHETISREEAAVIVIAECLNELAPARSVEEWAQHVRENGHDPDLFFGDNGQGAMEYKQFASTFDKDKHDKSVRKKLLEKQRQALKRPPILYPGR